MNVIWKRPDGFHGSHPSDYVVIELQTNSSRIWLHKKDKSNFPFRVSGGWQEESATRRLNELVNLLNSPNEEWVRYLKTQLHDSKFEDGQTFISDLELWLQQLKPFLKGDKWEIAVMSDTLEDLNLKIQEIKGIFLVDESHSLGAP